MKNGFTLLELLVSLAIGAIVAFIGVPTLSAFVADHRLSIATHSIQRDLTFARSHAISQTTYVSICPTYDGSSCSDKWDRRYIIYMDTNGNGVREAGENQFLRHGNVGEMWKIDWKAFGGAIQLTFTPKGTTKHQNGTVYVCAADIRLQRGSMILLNKAGRSRIAPDLDGDGFSEKSNGQAMTCD